MCFHRRITCVQEDLDNILSTKANSKVFGAENPSCRMHLSQYIQNNFIFLKEIIYNAIQFHLCLCEQDLN